MKSKKSHKEWKTLVSQFKSSDLSMAGFCRKNNLKTSTFIYWVKMFSGDDDKPKMIKIKPKTATPKKTDNVTITTEEVYLNIRGVIKPEKLSKIISILMEVN